MERLHSLAWLFRLFLCFALAVILYLALTPEQPVTLGSDDANHIVAFLVLGVLGRLGFPRANVMAVIFPLFAFGVIIEALQSQMGRDASMDDLVADLIGLAIASLLTFLMRKAH